MSEVTFKDVNDRVGMLMVQHGYECTKKLVFDVFGTADSLTVKELLQHKWSSFVCRADALMGVAKTPTLDHLANTAEPKRPRLTWADTKPADRFEGYTVRKGSTDPQPNTGHINGFNSPDQTDTGHQVYFRHGSAAL